MCVALTEELVYDVRLGGVVGLAAVPHVLRAVEGLERQAVQEVPGVKQPCHWADAPPCLCLQYLGHSRLQAS